MPASAGQGLLRQAWGERSIRFFLLGAFLSNIGTWIQRIAVGWLVFDLTHSAGWVGAIAACELVPSLLVAPFGGVLVDRGDRLRLLAWGQVCAQMQAVLLAVLAAFDLVGIVTLAAAALTLGLIEGINQPARLALVSDVAPRPLVAATVSLNAFGFNGARFVGPIVAGLALTAGSPALAFALNGLSFVPFILLLLRLRHSPVAARIAASDSGDGIVGGLRHAAGHPVIGLTLLLLLTVSLTSRALVELLPAIAGKWFGPAPAELTWLTVSVGLGAMAGGVWMLRRGTLGAVLAATLAGPAGLAAAMLLFAFVGDTRWIAYTLLAAMGFLSLVSGSGTQSLIHLTASPAYRGRVLSLFGIIQRAAPAVGALLLGLLADAMGLGPAFVLGSAGGAAAWLWVWRRRRRLHKAVGAYGGSGEG
jgi:MFS family permease